MKKYWPQNIPERTDCFCTPLSMFPLCTEKPFTRREKLCVLRMSNSRMGLCMTLTASVNHEHSCQLCPIEALLILRHGFSASFFNRSIIFIQEAVPLTFVYVGRRRVQMQRHPRAPRLHVDGMCRAGPFRTRPRLNQACPASPPKVYLCCPSTRSNLDPN